MDLPKPPKSGTHTRNCCRCCNCSLIANEFSDSYLKSNWLGILYEVDSEKAFDHVAWDFLMTLLDITGFPSK